MNPPWYTQEHLKRRFLTTWMLPKQPRGHCRWCGQPVQPPRRSWCSDACVTEYTVRSGMAVAEQVLKRDHGVCAQCGIDCEEVRALMRRVNRVTRYMTWYRDAQFRSQWGPWGFDPSRRTWEADHIVPVVEGGGCCGLDNYRTLCLCCHKRETAMLARRRSGRGKQPELFDVQT